MSVSVAREYEAVLVNLPNLSIVDIDRNVARLAAKLHADFNVTPLSTRQRVSKVLRWSSGRCIFRRIETKPAQESLS